MVSLVETREILTRQTEDEQDDLLFSLVTLWFLHCPTPLIQWGCSPWDRSVYCSICTYKDVCGEVTWIILFGKLTEISVSYKYRINIFWMHAHFPGPQNFDPCFDRLFYQHILSYPLGSSALEKLCFS